MPSKASPKEFGTRNGTSPDGTSAAGPTPPAPSTKTSLSWSPCPAKPSRLSSGASHEQAPKPHTRTAGHPSPAPRREGGLRFDRQGAGRLLPRRLEMGRAGQDPD